MTRIFEALKKAKAESLPAQAPTLISPGGPRPVATALRPALRAPEPRTAGNEPLPLPPLPDEVTLELTHLRYALESALAGRTHRLVAVCSAQGREGSTTVACQLGRVLAQGERARVLIVDGHSRRPGLAHALGLTPEGTLREALWSQAHGGAPLPAVEHRGLRVLCARPERGTAFPMGELREFLAGMQSAYDWVILDLPPVLESAEAAAAAALADGALLVIRSGHSKKPVVARAAEVLRKAGANVIGSVLNRRRLEIPDFIYRRI